MGMDEACDGAGALCPACGVSVADNHGCMRGRTDCGSWLQLENVFILDIRKKGFFL